MFGKSKKSRDDEVGKPFDITSALPPSDDFRTSLLMTGLSARFSMLREQDDPNSKLGKASDDSVLFRRQSKLDFAFSGGLHDIAEVESIRAPQFARFDSFHSDDAASMNGSIMSRGKPTEGNNLFGGRQKIYKITAGNGSKPGGLPGRALYEDDVAVSAFQRWRQTEKERSSLEDYQVHHNADLDGHLDYNRKRGTNSTTSSGPPASRISTAATSVASQATPSLKDSLSSTIPTPIAGTPILERSVTRTRRLYEQGLNQDMVDQQSFAQSRMDTLSRQRTLGNRTPDSGPGMPSPATASYGDRAPERRQMLSKASAPNLRSFSPPATTPSHMSPAESGGRFPGPEQKTAFGGTPPLSPPISESEDYPALAIQPNDRGKATAMGVFQRPAQQYDESKYALRQRQLQHGRETPTGRFRAESNASVPTSRSRSSSSLHRVPHDKSEQAPVMTEPTVHEEGSGRTFFDDGDDSFSPYGSLNPRTGLQMPLERPNDHDHPAFRKSALPTPLTLSAQNSKTPSPTSDRNDFLTVDPAQMDSEDSPTLPDGAGLSGMVRQHLRNESTTSSVYPQDNDSDIHVQLHNPDVKRSVGGPRNESGDWGLDEADWDLSYGDGREPPRSHPIPPPQPTRAAPEPSGRQQGSSPEPGAEQDEFAKYLADGARRVREKLGSFVESDSGASTPVVPLSESALPSRETSRSRPTGLGMLRSKSSRGSLADRTREQRERSRSRPPKFAVGNSAINSLPSPKPAMDLGDDFRREESPTPDDKSSDRRPSDENIHAGLKAFRLARRELQKMKEMELQQRYNGPQDSPGRNRAPSQPGSPNDVILPALTYKRNPSEEVRNASNSRSESRATSDRDRSSSENSMSGRPAPNGMTRLRNDSTGYEEHRGMNGYGMPPGVSRQGPMMRSPMKPAGGSPGPFSRSDSSHTFALQSRHDPYDSSTLPTPNGTAGTFAGPGGARPNGYSLNSTTSTPNLHAAVSAPPLPPINPRRKNTRPGMSPGEEDGFMTSPSKMINGRGGLAMSEEELGKEQFRQRLRKAPSEATVMNGRGRSKRTSPPHPTVRPPPPPTTMSAPNMHRDVPGGMI